MGATEACREWAKAYQASMMNLRHHMTRFLEVRHCDCEVCKDSSQDRVSQIVDVCSRLALPLCS